MEKLIIVSVAIIIIAIILAVKLYLKEIKKKKEIEYAREITEKAAREQAINDIRALRAELEANDFAYKTHQIDEQTYQRNLVSIEKDISNAERKYHVE